MTPHEQRKRRLWKPWVVTFFHLLTEALSALWRFLRPAFALPFNVHVAVLLVHEAGVPADSAENGSDDVAGPCYFVVLLWEMATEATDKLNQLDH
jgi:hypothetical protein